MVMKRRDRFERLIAKLEGGLWVMEKIRNTGKGGVLQGKWISTMCLFISDGDVLEELQISV